MCAIRILGEGEIVATKPKSRSIEFIGDSVTCGYGILSPAADSPFKTKEEVPYITFDTVAANALNADFNVVAISGWAVYKSCFGDDLIIPPIYEYADALHQPDIKWDFSSFQPNAVVVYLGGNDYSYLKTHTGEYGSFVSSYASFHRISGRLSSNRE